MGIKLVDIYSRLVEFCSKNSNSNKEIDELKEKYSELEKKYEKLIKDQADARTKDEKIISLEDSLKEKDKELKAKEKEIASLEMAVVAYKEPITKKETAKDSKIVKINELLDKPYQNPLTVREYNKIFKLMKNIDDWDLESKVKRRIRDDISLVLSKYPDPDDTIGYFKLKRNLKQLRRYYDVLDKGSVSDIYKIKILMDDYAKELKDKWSNLSKNVPFYGIIGTALAGLIGSSIYFNFSNYVAAAGIGAAVSSLISATAGVIVDKIRCNEYDATIGGGIFGAVSGAVCGPIAYGILDLWEKNGDINWFDTVTGAADVVAKGGVGGVVGSLALLALIIKFSD